MNTFDCGLGVERTWALRRQVEEVPLRPLCQPGTQETVTEACQILIPDYRRQIFDNILLKWKYCQRGQRISVRVGTAIDRCCMEERVRVAVR